MAIVQSFVAEHPRTVGVVASVGVVIILAWRMRPRPGPNPFSKDSSRASRPLVTDKATRNKVLKQGFSSKTVPSDLDAIVIGSGPGGLTAAALLSKAGKRVLVLEQHDQAGGCCHSFEEEGYEFDSGIHYVGDMPASRMIGCLFSQLTEGQVEWAPLVPELDVLALGEPGKQKFFSFISGSRETWKQGLLKSFPDEEAALDKYIAKLKAASSAPLFALKLIPKPLARFVVKTGLIHLFSSYFKYATLSLQDVLDEVTDNKDLQAALAFNLGDYGTPPSKSSFMMHAMLTNHYTYGAYYPRGGSSEIAFHMIPVIEKSGGRVLVRARVTEILTDDSGRVIGVRVDKGKDANIFAPMIISDAGVLNTLQSLLPRQVAAKSSISKYLGSELRNGVSIMQLFVGLKGSPEELGVKAQNIWAYTDNNINGMFDKVQMQSASDAASSTVPVMFISFPTAKDPSREERFPGKCACAVVTFANWQWFSEWEQETQGKRGAAYENIKKEFAEQIWAQVVALYPQLKDKVEYFNLGSPLTGQYYLAAPQGEGYGLDHCRARFSSPDVVVDLRPDIGIPGLLLTGQDVTMCGLAGGMLGGLLCASRALNRNLFSDIKTLTKSIAKKQ